MNRGAKVLVVDDESLVRGMTAALLREEGYDVLEAAGGDEALVTARADAAVSVVLTDVNMPGMDGFELARILLDERPGLKLILTSGKEGLEAEADPRFRRILAKPYSMAQLLDAVERAVDEPQGETLGV